MNHQNDKTILGSLDPEVLTHLSTRREALGRVAKLGAGAMTVPLVLAALVQDANAKTMSPGVFAVLNFALLLERLESEFYSTALAARGLIPDEHRAVFEKIGSHEREHVTLLGAATGHLVNTDKFDYTAGGRFPDVFRNYRTFLALSATFEDTGVRAYKGQAANLMPVPLLLGIALRIHSVEARHAAEVRRLRGEKGWISASSRGSKPTATQASYNGDGLTNQGGVHLAGAGGTPATAASEAFDEPLTKAQVLAIVSPFIIRAQVVS